MVEYIYNVESLRDRLKFAMGLDITNLLSQFWDYFKVTIMLASSIDNELGEVYLIKSDLTDETLDKFVVGFNSQNKQVTLASIGKSLKLRDFEEYAVFEGLAGRLGLTLSSVSYMDTEPNHAVRTAYSIKRIQPPFNSRIFASDFQPLKSVIDFYRVFISYQEQRDKHIEDTVNWLCDEMEQLE